MRKGEDKGGRGAVEKVEGREELEDQTLTVLRC